MCHFNKSILLRLWLIRPSIRHTELLLQDSLVQRWLSFFIFGSAWIISEQLRWNCFWCATAKKKNFSLLFSCPTTIWFGVQCARTNFARLLWPYFHRVALWHFHFQRHVSLGWFSSCRFVRLLWFFSLDCFCFRCFFVARIDFLFLSFSRSHSFTAGDVRSAGCDESYNRITDEQTLCLWQKSQFFFSFFDLKHFAFWLFLVQLTKSWEFITLARCPESNFSGTHLHTSNVKWMSRRMEDRVTEKNCHRKGKRKQIDAKRKYIDLHKYQINLKFSCTPKKRSNDDTRLTTNGK